MTSLNQRKANLNLAPSKILMSSFWPSVSTTIKTVKQLMINWHGNKLQKKLLSEIADVIILVLKFIALFITRTVLTNWLDSFQQLVVALPKELAMFSK
ncbi:hypothetical protein PHOSAC3_150162 [Mesotoga infera]|nr:hypothetical protein PHOSAC3_150162 [Mesotoga infera]